MQLLVVVGDMEEIGSSQLYLYSAFINRLAMYALVLVLATWNYFLPAKLLYDGLLFANN